MRLIEVSQTRQALGSDVSLTIVTSMTSEATTLVFDKLWQQIYLFERQFSRFLPMSELSVFNRAAGLKTFITPEFKELLVKAKLLGVKTGGLYNPFILPALQRAGYRQSAAPGYENDPQEDHSLKQVVSVDQLVIGDTWATIPYGTAIDMGGCGKGYLADQLGQYLSEQSEIKGYWLSLGGDVSAWGHDAFGKKISLGIQDAEDLDSNTDWIINCSQEHTGIATSGTFRRQNQNDVKSWHHIIDPISLKPAVTDIRLATVCANSAIDADVLASCAIILGSKKALEFLKKHGAKAALLQCTDKDSDNFQLKFGDMIKKDRSKLTEGILQNV